MKKYFSHLGLLISPFYYGNYQLMTRILMGMIVGLIIGPIVGVELATLLAIPGDIFLGMIKMIVGPLVFVAVMLGIADNDDIAIIKKVGGLVVVYFLISTLISTSWGSALVVFFEPGNGLSEAFKQQAMGGMVVKSVAIITPDAPWYEAIRSGIKDQIPGNPLQSMVFGYMLQLVISAALLGTALLTVSQYKDSKDEIKKGLAQKSIVMIGYLELFQEIILKVVNWAMLIAPIGVLGLMAYVTATSGFSVVISLSGYVSILLIALFTYTVVVYSLTVKFLAGRSPMQFFKAIRPLQIMAFSTSSSAAVMPLSIETAEKQGVSAKISKFIIPLGTTINMDGTAMYQAVAAIFLMQAFGVDITFSTIAMILGTAILASVGTPGTPGVGLIILGGILISAGLPEAAIGIIFGVDRPLDMCRTAVNVTGDQCAALVMNRYADKKKNK
jgi:Na+/H+-dicarboxylate symporter